MSRVGDDSGTPRAVIHKKILDVAASDPNASMEAIASEVSGASVDLVERVLDEYGDPCEEPTSDAAVNRSDLSDKQRDTLRAIVANPDCSQAELAEEFDVTRPTISRWVNDIPGFEWSRRHEIATRILGAGDGGSTGNGDDPADEDGERASRENGDGGGAGAVPSTADTGPTDAGPGGEDDETTEGAQSADPEAIEELRDRSIAAPARRRPTPRSRRARCR